jgi:hypothetical protein
VCIEIEFFFLTEAQHHTKTQHVTKNRGRHCGVVQLAAYLANAAGPVSLVLDLRIAHDRFGSSSDPSLNGHLHYPNDTDKSLNEAAADKIRKYRPDYNNNPLHTVSFMPAIARTFGRLHSEFMRLLFLQAHRETDRFFAASGVQIAQSTSGLFHFRRAAFSSTLKARSAVPSPRLQLYVLHSILMGRLSLQEHILTHHTRKRLVY